MPFTPFHFGFGLAAKAALPAHFGLLHFVALQVIIDVETRYNLVHRNYPVHGFLHTFLGAGLLAALTAAAILFGRRCLRRSTSEPHRVASAAPVFVTALLSTWSHVVFDGIMHADCRPFHPFTQHNPLLGAVEVRTLYAALVGIGLAAVLVLLVRLAAGAAFPDRREEPPA